MSEDHRIPFGYYLPGFETGGAKELLRDHGQEVIPEEYDEYMYGNIFCYICTVPLSRVPKEKEVTTSGKTPHFRHRRGFSHIDCAFRTDTAPGKKYTSKESIAKAIEDGELSIVSEWMDEPPEINDMSPGEFSDAQIEDKDGEETEIPLGEHSGESFKVPSRVSSVFSLCRNFADNLIRYYYFPESSHPIRLVDALVDLQSFNEDYFDKTNVYHGIIHGYVKLEYRNIIKIISDSDEVINIYTNPALDERRGIGRNSIGRRVMVHGKIVKEGVQVRIWALRWGQYALVPERTNEIIEAMARRGDD